jgi:hypothetical protein
VSRIRPGADELPYVDEHAISIAAPRELVWSVLQHYASTSLRIPQGPARLLGTEPPAGFEVAESAPTQSLTLVGRHRFSRYMLAFDLTDGGEGATQLRARTYAQFPGLRGQAYRALVIGTHAHVVATKHLLRKIRRRSLEST